MSFERVDPAAVSKPLAAALARLGREDTLLLERGAAERSICHRLAVYLECEYNAEREADRLHVDCEYNLYGDDAEENLRKRIVMLFDETDDLSVETVTDEPMGGVVFPDIIVHRRGSRNNQLVIEAKLIGNATPGNVKSDMLRLQAFRDVCHYRYGTAAFILFLPGNTNVLVAPDRYAVYKAMRHD